MTSKRVAVLQSNYLPWKGYFDIIHDVDLFVFYDDVQYTAHDWRNRNRMKTASGVRWLTIPLGTRIDRRICDVELPGAAWRAEHRRRIRASYQAAPWYSTYAGLLERVYEKRRWSNLSDFNQHVIAMIARDVLGIPTELADSRDHSLSGRKLDRLVELLVKVGATTYVSGPAAKAYLDETRLAEAGIAVEWKDYSGYPEYPQLHPPFVHEVFVLDLLFHVGPQAPHFIWGWREAGRSEADGPHPAADAGTSRAAPRTG